MFIIKSRPANTGKYILADKGERYARRYVSAVSVDGRGYSYGTCFSRIEKAEQHFNSRTDFDAPKQAPEDEYTARKGADGSMWLENSAGMQRL